MPDTTCTTLGWSNSYQPVQKRDSAYYTDYSIGFLTRECFRKCSFCVNQNYNRVYLTEFLDLSRPKICLLDDNFLGFPKWKTFLSDLQ